MMSTIDKFNQFYEDGGYENQMRMIKKRKDNRINKQSEATELLAQIFMDFVRGEGKVDKGMMEVFIIVSTQTIGEL